MVARRSGTRKPYSDPAPPFKDMAKEREDWSDLDATVADGLDVQDKW